MQQMDEAGNMVAEGMSAIRQALELLDEADSLPVVINSDACDDNNWLKCRMRQDVAELLYIARRNSTDLVLDHWQAAEIIQAACNHATRRLMSSLQNW
jgi:hypothetical protein